MNGQDRHNGFTLVELLIVMAIIIVITTVTVPSIMRSGMFGGNPTDAAARDLFALLRASQVYATTNNVDTAIAYGIALQDGERPQDSLFTGSFDTNDSSPIGVVPFDYQEAEYPGYNIGDYKTDPAVFNSAMLIRKITIQELNQVSNGQSLASAIITEFNRTEHDNPILLYDDTKDIYIPVGSRFGSFEEFPSDTCLLTNSPRYWQPTPPTTLDVDLGLGGVYIIRYSVEFFSVENANAWVVDRLLPSVNNDKSISGNIQRPDQGLPNDLDATWKNKFPAHVFKKTGGLKTSNQSKQRIILSMGLLLDKDYEDRYMLDEEDGELFMREEYYFDPDKPDPDPFQLIGRETDIHVYVSTGRVKVAKDDE